ncbi:MAG: hypothetical protein Q8928_08950 [Bacteroidota bacterium]|nr:hypothetical protein [Bacteroidota bacterium]
MKLQYQIIILFFALSTCSGVLGQTTTSSPYSMYGIGDLRQSGFSQNRAMGGSGIALSTNSSLNPINPASLSGIDSLFFLLESGMEGRLSTFKDGSQTQHPGRLNFSYLAFGFRGTKWWGTSMGITPYSTVGNNIITKKTIEGTTDFLTIIQHGEGGFNQFYWANSFRLLKGLSVGINFSYLFGTIKQTEESSNSRYFSGSLTQETNTDLRNMMLNYGIQYSVNISKDIKGTIGGIYGNKYNFTLNQQDVLRDESVDKNLTFPTFWGVGIALNLYQRLTLTSDYKCSYWSKSNSSSAYSYAKNTLFTDSKDFSVGLEYSASPSIYSNLIQRSRIRLGAYYSTPYIMIGGDKLRDAGITAGLGLPVSPKLRINLSYQYGQKGTINSGTGVITEKYQAMTFGITFSDIWFFKPKYD